MSQTPNNPPPNTPPSVIPAPATNDPPTNRRNDWVWGFSPQAEIWNSRFAMIGFVAVLATELFTGDGVLYFWNILSHPAIMP